MMIGPRRLVPELMDAPDISPEQHERALDELATLNRWLGGYSTSRMGIQRVLAAVPHDGPVTILDVGSGGTNLARVLSPLGRRFEVTALDMSEQAGNYGRRQGDHIDVVAGSAHQLPFADRSFDIAHASLFLHHCTAGEATHLLRRLTHIARYGIVINDLHRHSLAYMGISTIATLFSRSALVRHDGPASVRRGFTRGELQSVLPSAARSSALITWHWAFRWCATIALNGRDD